MKWLLSNGSVIGLMLAEREIVAAQMSRSGKRLRVEALARMAWDLADDPADAEALGRRLREMLRAAGLNGRRVVVGLPARWVMSRMQTTPPIEGHALAQTLRLMADRIFSSDAQDLVIDFVEPGSGAQHASGESAPSGNVDAEQGGQQVLVLATARRRVEQVQAVATAAGLKVEAIMPTVLALGAWKPSAGARCVALCADQATDLAVWRDGRLVALRHVVISATQSVEQTAAALQRVLATEASIGPASGDWLAIEVAGDQAAVELAQAALAHLQLESGVIDAADVGAGLTFDASASMAGETGGGVAAAALGLAGLGGERRLVDWGHSKLAPVRASRFSRPWRIAVLAGAAALLLLALLYMQLLDAQAQHGDLAYQLDQMADDVESAEAVLAQMSHVEGWFDQRPRPLDYLREMTLAFPERGVIWASEVTLRDEAAASIVGGAEESRHVLELRDRLERSAYFENVNLQYLREAGRQRREVSFSMVMSLRRPKLSESEASANQAGPVAKRDDEQTGAQQ